MLGPIGLRQLPHLQCRQQHAATHPAKRLNPPAGRKSFSATFPVALANEPSRPVHKSPGAKDGDVPIACSMPTTPPATPTFSVSAPPGRRYGVQNSNSRITLRLHRPARVAVRARNRTFIDRSLAAGDTYRVPNLVGLTLVASDAGAVEVILDGSSMGFMGEDGERTGSQSLNPQNIVDRQQRG